MADGPRPPGCTRPRWPCPSRSSWSPSRPEGVVLPVSPPETAFTVSAATGRYPWSGEAHTALTRRGSGRRPSLPSRRAGYARAGADSGLTRGGPRPTSSSFRSSRSSPRTARDGTVLLSPVWHEWRDGGFSVSTTAERRQGPPRDPRIRAPASSSPRARRRIAGVEVRLRARGSCPTRERGRRAARPSATWARSADAPTPRRSGDDTVIRLEPGETPRPGTSPTSCRRGRPVPDQTAGPATSRAEAGVRAARVDPR